MTTSALSEVRAALRPLAYTHGVALRHLPPDALLVNVVAYPALTVADALRARDALASLDALSQQPADDGWHGMDSAPKDGTEILVADAAGVHKVAWLDDSVGRRRGQHRIFAWCVPGSWQDEQGGHYTIDEPTHWQPLPAAPKPGSGESGVSQP